MSSQADYLHESENCENFLRNYLSTYEDENGDTRPLQKYMELLQNVANRTHKIIDIELDDVLEFNKDEAFVKRIEQNTMRYIRLFSAAVDKLLPPSTVGFDETDVLDVVRDLRTRSMDARRRSGLVEDVPYPQDLLRRYELRIVPTKETKVTVLRDIRAPQIGRLVRVRGIVTRVTEVKPLLVVATYTCDECSLEIFQEITSPSFMPQMTCPSTACTSRGKGSSKVTIQPRGSKFIKFQEIKIQELTEQVPIGHIPRSMKIYVKGELTRSCSPGDIVTIAGVFLPTPYTGIQAVRAGLIADTFVEAVQITQHKKSYADYILTKEILQRITKAAQERNIYSRLAKSIAPEIYGHEDVKKALLLMMVGGVTRTMRDGMKIRGDINICLMGDPGVAKSQLLKHIAVVAPRGIYTSGKGSSGVGLTAAVIRDPLTSEFVLEGGSLVLADMGICCIDEFDKMEETDRTSIHEVMEQQTISIAKAGITTTLNARTSILAAANPAYGRYNPHKSPEENFNLPAALLSRFDLLFLIVDRPDLETDRLLAEHVTYVHQQGEHPPLDIDVFDSEFIRSYIAQSRQIEPFIPRELTEYIVAAYVNMRVEEDRAKTSANYTTARTLLAILRLAQASARLRFSEIVEHPDVEEAMRLMFMSKVSIYNDDRKRRTMDPSSDIYTIIRDFAATTGVDTVNYHDILPRVLAKGHTQQQLNECLAEYQALNVWLLDATFTRISFVS